jgi:hypothetical protein
MRRGDVERAVLEQQDLAELRLAQVRGALGDDLQHRLDVGRRSRRDAQDLGDRGLLLERLLGLVEQAHVVDGDRGLAREGLDQRDLVVAEAPGDVPREDDAAVRVAAAHQRDDQHRPQLEPHHVRARGGELVEVLADVGEVEGGAVGRGAPGERRAVVGHVRRVGELRGARRHPALVARDRVEDVAVDQQDARVGRVAQERRPLGDDVEHRLHVGRRARDHAQDLGDGRLLLERVRQLVRALVDLALEAGVRLAQVRGHPVELGRERLELVAGPDVDRVVELALADQLGPFLQRADRAREAARQEQRDQRRDHEAAEQQEHDALDRRVERREHLGLRLLDEHLPAERVDVRVRGQHLDAGGVAREHDGVVPGAAVERGLHVRQPGQVGLAQHEPDVGVGDQVAGRIDDVGLALVAGADARDDLPHELEVDVGDRHRAAGAARSHRDLHVRLGLLAEVDLAVPRARAGRLEVGGVARRVAQAVADLVHLQARDDQLAAAVGAEVGDVGDVGHLLQSFRNSSRRCSEPSAPSCGSAAPRSWFCTLAMYCSMRLAAASAFSRWIRCSASSVSPRLK